MTAMCTVADCDGSTLARGMCSKHYWRVRRHGTTDEEVLAHVRRDPGCSVPECTREHEAKGYCAKHYLRLSRHGSVEAGHHQWGEVPGYQRAHQIVHAARGRASDHPCACLCGQQAAEWAYDHTDPNELIGTDHGWSLPYSLDPDRYRPMAAACHRKFDTEHKALEGALA